jgi:hypothetical protein
MKKIMHLFLPMFFCLHLGAHDLMVMPGYKNGIENVAVYEEQGNAVIEFTFTSDQNDPVCNYVPLSFEESMDDEVKRYHIPLTDINEGEIEEMIQYIADLCDNVGIDLEISLCDAPCQGLDCLFILENGLQVEKQINEEERTVSFIIF